MKKRILALLTALCLLLPLAAFAENLGLDDAARETLANELYANYGKDISGTIEFYQQKPEIEEWYDEAIALFMELYPNITVEQNVQSDASDVLRVRAASGEFTDVWLYWPTDFIFASFQASGLLMDVSDEPFVQYSGEGAQILYNFDGNMYGVPIAMNCAGLVCNVGLFEKYGLELPTTWDEYMNVCQKFKEVGMEPLVINAKTGGDLGVHMIYGNFVTTDQVKAIARGELKFSDLPGWSEAIDLILEEYTYAPGNAASTDYNDAVTNFATEQGAMYPSGNWILNSVEAINPGIKLVMVPMPAGEGYVTSGIDVGLSIGANTKYPEACKAFVNFLSCSTIAGIYCNHDGAIPAIKGVELSDQRVTRMADAIAKGKSFNWPGHFFPTGGAESAFDEALSTLFVNRDKAAFMQQVDAAMSGAK